MKIIYKKRKFYLPAREVSFFRRGVGLMFRTRGTSNLLFNFSRKTNLSITSWFVFFPFLAVWLDEQNRVVDFEMVRPFRLTISSARPFCKLVELPANTSNKKIIDFFVGERKV